MTPGRFVSLWFLYLGSLILLQYVLGVALGDLQVRISLGSFGWLVPGATGLYFGITRLRHPEQEKWPSDYGLWTYGAASVLVIATGWLLYALYADYLAPL